MLAWYNPGQTNGYTQTNCASFVRSSSSYLYTSSTSWLDGLSKLTIALDVRVNNVDIQEGWITRWNTNEAQFVLRCNGNGNIVFIVATSLTDTGANYVITPNNVLYSELPARVVVVYDEGNVTIYINGDAVLNCTTVGTIPSSLTSGATEHLLIGADYNTQNFHDGLMSRACMWAGTALSAAAVASDFNWWIGRDPAGSEPFAPTHAWRLNEVSGSRNDCIGTINLTDANSNVGSEAHVSQVTDQSGNGFHAQIRPINGPTLISSGLNGHPTIKHVAANGQFLVTGIHFPVDGINNGNVKPYRWSLYAIAMCTSTVAPSGQSSNGLVNSFGVSGVDRDTWLVCVFGDTGGSGAPAGSFGMGCGDGSNYNEANSNGSTYSANTWFRLTGIFPGGISQVNTWFNGTSQTMNLITGAQPCECSGPVDQTVIGGATAEGSGYSGVGVTNNDFFDGQWADIAICGTDTSSQRLSEQQWQKTYGNF